ncbi:MAG: hypothetical protein WDN10_01285 [bacterium]
MRTCTIYCDQTPGDFKPRGTSRLVVFLVVIEGLGDIAISDAQAFWRSYGTSARFIFCRPEQRIFIGQTVTIFTPGQLLLEQQRLGRALRSYLELDGILRSWPKDFDPVAESA